MAVMDVIRPPLIATLAWQRSWQHSSRVRVNKTPVSARTTLS
jgi:hypothetical protein